MRQRLRQRGLLLLAWTGLVTAVLAQAAMAQEPPPAADAPRPANTAKKGDARAGDALPGEVGPHVYYFKDADGNLQAVPGITYEEIMEAWKHEIRLAQENRRPSFDIQSLVISGTASGSTADLLAQFTIAVHEAGWVGVPLRLNDAVLREQPAYAGPGDHVLSVEPDRHGYVVWIRGQADQTHEVTLKLVVAVEQLGPQSRLQLGLPRSAFSQLQLQVPLARAVAKVSEGSKLDAVRTLAGGKTELKASGLGGDFELSWHPADAPVASVPTNLEVTGAQVIRMNGRNVSTDALLTVRSLGSEFDQFQVRLPPGADYVGTPKPGMSLVALDASAAAGKLYNVKLDKKTTGPIELRLVTERAHNSAQDNEMLQLAGFEVPGAVRQGGTIEVQVEGNWQVVWGETNQVRPVDDVGGPARRDDLIASFEYFVQPYSLAARVVPQKTRVRVEPEYVLLVGSEETQLHARLKYTIRGARLRSLEVELPGWEVDTVGPPELVNVDAEIAGVGESLVIPLLQATTGDLELTFEAHRKTVPGADSVSLELPRPKGDVAAAEVAIVSDDNVELVPQPEQMTALAPQAVRPQMKLPERQQDPLYYRATAEAAKFVASVTLHEQSISASVTTQLDVGVDETRVESRLAFQIAYQPTDHLTLRAPRSIAPERMTILYDGQPIAPVPLRTPLAGDAQTTPWRVNLPAPRIGRCELQVSYTLRREKPPTEKSAPAVVPLVVPGEGQLTSNILSVVPKTGIAVSYPSGPWSEEPQSDASGNAPALMLTARRAIPEVTLAVSSKQSPSENSTIVERAWIETRLTDSGRQDRAVFRLSTGQPRLQLRLPGGADDRSLVVEVDAVEIAPESIRQREVTIPMPPGPRGEHLIEARYRLADRGPQGSLTLEGPQLVSVNWVQQFYWQLVLPEHEHVVFAPPGYTEEMSWVWSDFYWQRQPTLSVVDLEDWIGAEPHGVTARLPGATSNRTSGSQQFGSTNRYLFSSVGAIEPLNLYTVGRARLVLYASLPLLLCGLILIYFPATRHPAVLFFLAVMVAAASFVAPRPALLLAQASILGLALAGLAVLLARMLPRAAPATIPMRGSSHAVLERSVTELYQRPSTGGQPPSTSTDPLVPTSGEVE
jgi:hypothetical protein